MKRVCFALVLLSLALAGCSNNADSGGGTATPTAGGATGDTDATTPAGDDQSGGGGSDTATTGDTDTDTDGGNDDVGDNAAPAESAVAITPENTKIQFVGTHTDKDKPDPRTGTFGAFDGTANVDGGTLKSIEVEIETASLTTEIEKLTNHLRGPDFFNAKTHPKATFKSTKIEDAGDGTVNITGDLTLLGNTKSITFPATVSTDDGLTLQSEFTIDRTEFEMNYGLEGVEKAVAMTVTVGK